MTGSNMGIARIKILMAIFNIESVCSNVIIARNNAKIAIYRIKQSAKT